MTQLRGIGQGFEFTEMNHVMVVEAVRELQERYRRRNWNFSRPPAGPAAESARR